MGIMNALFRSAGRRRIYADLLHLDDHLLRDIGLTRGEVHDMIAGRGRRIAR